MNPPAPAGEDFEKRLRRGAVLRLTLDTVTLDDPDIATRSKYVIVVSALLPDENMWFIICTSKPGHFDRNPTFANDILRWVPGEYPWCTSAVTVVDCTTVHTLSTATLKERYANGQLAQEEGAGRWHPARTSGFSSL